MEAHVDHAGAGAKVVPAWAGPMGVL
jgi:hypothetical protein